MNKNTISQELKYHIKLLIGTLISLVGADGIISTFLVQNKLAIEANPWITNWVTKDSFPMVKIGIAFLCAFLLYHTSVNKPKLTLLTIVVLVSSYTLIVYWNVSVFLLAAL